MSSPYKNVPTKDWAKITEKLIVIHPLSAKEIKEIVLVSWDTILQSQIGNSYIGKDFSPKPQIMGFFLHELIQIEIEKRYPKVWRKEKDARDKDLVYIPNENYSIEIKTSSNPNSIFGNRSYAQDSENGKKSKAGYYLAINFEKFADTGVLPKILKIRFGWLDHEDWIGQTAATGQQSRLSRDVENYKLLQI